MRSSHSQRGSALLISLVVVIISVGLGGAFLTQTLFHSNEQKWAIEADEAMSMCDAGMERARQALGAYKTATPLWRWSEVVQYCSSAPTDGMVIKNSLAMPYFASAAFTGYTQVIWNSGQGSTTGTRVGATGSSADSSDPTQLLPQNSTTPNAAADQNRVLFGWPIAYNRGILFMTASEPGASGQAGEPTNLLVRVTAVLPSGLVRQVEGVISKQPPNPTTGPGLHANGLAAVVSDDQVSMNGNTTIDGRDYNYGGTAVVGPGVYGVLSVKTVNVGGSAATGGQGAAPPGKGSASGSLAQNYAFSGGYPPDPDTALGLNSNQLKDSAIATGTYCPDASSFSALISANNGKLPSHVVIYCDFDASGGSLEMGSGNTQASILVFHNDTTSSTIQNVHGTFTGLLMADAIVHVNAGTKIVGEVQMFSPTASSAGNVFGNGNSSILFSSAVLADLPGLTTAPSASAQSGPATLLAYRRLE